MGGNNETVWDFVIRPVGRCILSTEKKGSYEACAKALKRVYILCMERERQKRVDLEMTTALSHYQGIDALPHMGQSNIQYR